MISMHGDGKNDNLFLQCKSIYVYLEGGEEKGKEKHEMREGAKAFVVVRRVYIYVYLEVGERRGKWNTNAR